MTRGGFANEYPSVAQLFRNKTFTITAENKLMSALLEGNTNRRRVPKQWLDDNAGLVANWTKGISRTPLKTIKTYENRLNNRKNTAMEDFLRQPITMQSSSQPESDKTCCLQTILCVFPARNDLFQFAAVNFFQHKRSPRETAPAAR